MNLFYIGQIDEAKVVNRTNKTTGQVTTNCQIIVTFESTDTDGYLVKQTENLQLDINELGAMQQAKGKYIMFPYQVLNTPKGTYVFPSSELQYQVFDKNPMEVKK